MQWARRRGSGRAGIGARGNREPEAVGADNSNLGRAGQDAVGLADTEASHRDGVRRDAGDLCRHRGPLLAHPAIRR